ncbi:MAG: hypothetical protein WCB58_10810 [Acidobacteriaceae bacterium]
MSDFLATALGLAFTLVVCLFAVHALLGPWLRLRRAPAAAAGHADEKHTSSAPTRRDATPIHMS